MGDVLQFGKKPPEHGSLYMTVDLYTASEGKTDYVVRRHDGGDVDIDDVLDRLNTVLTFTYLDREENHGGDRLMLTVRVFASSAIKCSWLHDEIESREGLAWLHRRFGDAYWRLDPRRGVAYHWHILRGKLRNFFLHQPKDEQK